MKFLVNFKDKFIKNAVFMFFTASFVGLANLIYQLILVRGLSTVNYATLNSLIAFLSIVLMPLGAFTTMVVRYSSMLKASQNQDKLHYVLAKLFKHNLIFSLVLSLATFLFRYQLANYLKLDTTIYIQFISIIIFFNGILPVVSGILQGLEKFYWLGSISTISGCAKISATFLLIKLGWNILGGLAGFLLATLFSLIFFALPVRKVILPTGPKTFIEKVDFKSMYFYLIPATVFAFTMTLLTNIDIVLVKHYFNTIDAGYYAVAQIIGKIVFFLPAAIAMVMFPRVSSLHTQNKEHLHVLKKALLFAASLCLVGVIGYNLFPGFTLKFLTGKANYESIQLGRLFCVAMGMFSLINILSFYYLSVSDFRFIKYLIIFSILQIVGIIIFHHTLMAVLITLCLSSLFLLLFSLKLAFNP